MAGEHGCWTKSCFYEGSAGIPFLARLPGVIRPGAVCTRASSLIDIAPTLTEIAQAGGSEECPELDTDGASLVGFLKGEAARMIRTDKWKIWQYGACDEKSAWDSPALYNLDAEPGETNDLANDAETADIKRRLLFLLSRGWDPEAVKEIVAEQIRDYRTLADWGRRCGPALPDRTGVDIARESFTYV